MLEASIIPMQESEDLGGRQSSQREASVSWLPSENASTSASVYQLSSSGGREKRLRLSGLPAERGPLRHPGGNANGYAAAVTSPLMSSAPGGFTEGSRVGDCSGESAASRGVGFPPGEDIRWAGSNHNIDSGPPVPRSSFA